MRVLVAGVSTRAMAESAARSGFAVTAIDAFADLDQHPSVDARSLGARFSAETAARESRGAAGDAVAYGANFENHPDAIAMLSHGRTLWGNPPDVIRRVRDPRLLSEALRNRGLAAPVVCKEPGTTDAFGVRRSAFGVPGSGVLGSGLVGSEVLGSRVLGSTVLGSRRSWLLKRYASGGGRGVREWRDGMSVPAGAYLQELIAGAPLSVVFAAANRRAIPIGLTRQLVGDESFGASGYQYCGNILTAAGEDDQVLAAARALADAVCDEFALVGVNGIDLILDSRLLYAIEVNPRWCASLELVERAYGLSVFGVHAAACRDGVLPDFNLENVRRSAPASGKAIVFARRDVTVGDTSTWLSAGEAHTHEIRDVPKPGTHIRAGRPICTVFATAGDSRACRDELVSRAERVYAAVAAVL